MSETNLMKKCMKAVSGAGVRIFRNNVGQAWAGKHYRVNTAGNYFCDAGDVIVRKARVFHGGLCVGSGDCIGLTPVKITADMVGREIAVFTSLEIKTQKGRASKEQLRVIGWLL